MKTLKETTKFKCGHTRSTELVFCSDIDVIEERITDVSYPCYECQQSMIGTRQTVVRYGHLPTSGHSYNYRSNSCESGVSCYLPSMRARPEFTDRPKLVFSAVVVGWGGDDEPLIDIQTINQ